MFTLSSTPRFIMTTRLMRGRSWPIPWHWSRLGDNNILRPRRCISDYYCAQARDTGHKQGPNPARATICPSTRIPRQRTRCQEGGRRRRRHSSPLGPIGHPRGQRCIYPVVLEVTSAVSTTLSSEYMRITKSFTELTPLFRSFSGPRISKDVSK